MPNKRGRRTSQKTVYSGQKRSARRSARRTPVHFRSTSVSEMTGHGGDPRRRSLQPERDGPRPFPSGVLSPCYRFPSSPGRGWSGDASDTADASPAIKVGMAVALAPASAGFCRTSGGAEADLWTSLCLVAVTSTAFSGVFTTRLNANSPRFPPTVGVGEVTLGKTLQRGPHKNW